MQLVKLNHKDVILRIDNLEYVSKICNGIKCVNSSGREWEISYGTMPSQQTAKDLDFEQLLKLLVKREVA